MVVSARREQIDQVTAKLAGVLEALHLTPNAVTLLALAISGSAAVLVALGHFITGALVFGVGGVMDIFDGALARRMGRTTTFGGYLDSLLDRYVDGFMFAAIGWHYDEAWIWAVCFLAFLGAAATSYAKARTYQDVRPPVGAWHDLFERPERLLLVLFSVGFQGIADAAGRSEQFLPWVVVAAAVLGHVTVVQRALRAKRYLEEGARAR